MLFSVFCALPLPHSPILHYITAISGLRDIRHASSPFLGVKLALCVHSGIMEG